MYEIEPPPEALKLSRHDRIDYVDAFQVPLDCSAEALARLMLEDASPPRRASLLTGWALLGLDVEAGASDRILGWRVRRGDGHVTLVARSRLGFDAELLFAELPGGPVFATMLRQSPPARLLWAPIARPHRRIVGELLEAAVSRARRPARA